jgi:anti-sigma factor RsiW
MIQHLTAEQISQWLMGYRTALIEQHLALCPECRAELSQMESTLTQFRGAMRDWSGTAVPPAWQRPAARSPWFSWPRLVWAAAALCFLVAVPVYWSVHARRQAAEAARADALLLERVDSAISRAVPEPMEPLVSLVTWNSSPTENRKKVEKQ